MKIAVALSGGVDSTAVALRLKSAGHEVVGLTMRLCPDLEQWPSTARSQTRSQTGLPDHACSRCGAPCACWESTQVAKQMGIRHELLDLREEFEKRVIGPFVQGFAAGETPNPCALCNREMKFGLLANYARDLGADYLATGHYGRIALQPRPVIHRARDQQKDQTYFLALVPIDHFKNVLFPLGETTKAEVQEEVQTQGMREGGNITSTEICFLRGLDYVDFLRARVPRAFQNGPIVDLAGRELGQHQGLPAYTIGQRRGLGLAMPYPVYVIRLESQANRVVIGPDQALWSQVAWLKEMNWLVDEPPGPQPIKAQVRYRQQPVSGQFEKTGPQAGRLDFDQPLRAITPGQVAALYAENRLVAGGIIMHSQAEAV